MDMQAKTCIITGATSGIGKETAFELASSGMKVILCGRNQQKCAEVCREIINNTGNSKIEYYTFDLSSLQSIKIFTEKIYRKYDKIDFLINNAGIWEKERKLSSDGIEMTFSVNHLGTLFLTILLKELLATSGNSSVINLSSSAYKQGKIDLDDIEMKNRYNGFKAYASSKLINLLVMKYLSLKYNEIGITINNIHPGVVMTGIYKDFNPLMKFAFKIFMISPVKGAAPVVSLINTGKSQRSTGRFFDRFEEKDILSDDNSQILGEQLWHISIDYFKGYDLKIKN
jgi:NAD(P)-dependent dehydrogenase (short-subunit alcohol dehydrogenase family)